jgi:raffinose/stachyose/melibiose transport system permease protein
MYQGLGWCLLYYYAGVKGISEELYEAARIDGCGFVRLHLRITVPLLKPVIRVNLTLAVISALKQMETVFLTTHGGPGNSTQFLANYLYKRAFDNYEYGYGNAIAAIFVVICIAATLLMRYVLPTEEAEERRLAKRAERNSSKA